MLRLQYDTAFQDLYNPAGLARLDTQFLKTLHQNEPELYNAVMLARSAPGNIEGKAESELIIQLAPIVEEFIATLFGIQHEVAQLQAAHHKEAPIFACKRLFVQRQAARSFSVEQAQELGERIAETSQTLEKAGIDLDDELSFATAVMSWQSNSTVDPGTAALIEGAKIYAAWALYTTAGKQKHYNGVLFKVPKKLDYTKLINLRRKTEGTHQNCTSTAVQHPRTGFSHTDPGISLRQALDNAHYCIFCHNQGKDSCAHGIKDKESGQYSKNALNATLTGCPLEEKISEMNSLKSQGWAIGALAVVTIDNPLAAATGHRICNDCMKSCIYQKQDPVDIPMIESRTLSDVLALPWGFEIYSLLTRWNPLNFCMPLPKNQTEYKVLVAGLGPAGFTLAHYLLQSGHIVVAVDGLKIEPLPASISGITLDGKRQMFEPIKDVQSIFQDLAERKAYGFGGVAEYGITVRWQKNYLTIIRLLLERRANFRMYGGVRFGSNISYDKAWELGFDHICLALGAGRPNLPEIPNILADGVRTASDFLMSLQLTGAARADSIANLQMQLPVVVIGGGLTAVDAATESLAYYQTQVEKYLQRYEQYGEEIFAGLNDTEVAVGQEFITHAKSLRKISNAAERIELIKQWGGVKVAYRKSLEDAPSYRMNHEELDKALNEGIEFVEHAPPHSITVDSSNHCTALQYTHVDGSIASLPARTILIATGTKPNTVLARESSQHFNTTINGYFAALDEHLQKQEPERNAKPHTPYVLTTAHADGRKVSFFGDLHPSYAGNVVKAMASAKQGYPVVCASLDQQQPASHLTHDALFTILDSGLLAVVEKVEMLAPKIVEVLIKAPFMAEAFQPGQFFRLQNYETNALRKNGLVLAMEGLALTGAAVDKERGLVSLIVLMMGGSSDICATLREGEQVVLMGPTGTPTHLPERQTVMLVGGGLGNAVLFSIGKALRERGCQVLYFAGYRNVGSMYKLDEIEAAADIVVWCADDAKPSVRRDSDYSWHGNIIEAITAYGDGRLGRSKIRLEEIEHIITIGSDLMMQAFVHARYGSLSQVFPKDTRVIASINSPMQCMMKEICAQCLQRHVDPQTGRESYVYSCYNQDQDGASVDFASLHIRLKQNCVQERATVAALAIDNAAS
ncbi:MAG: FAD-dependent oxidoreductase [Proteobacteria bacterium]|nr:FAD-dependent oxidoreductase [Pseudomonadota bacterium]